MAIMFSSYDQWKTSEPEEPEVFAECDECGNDICIGDVFFEFDSDYICDYCLKDMVKYAHQNNPKKIKLPVFRCGCCGGGIYDEEEYITYDNTIYCNDCYNELGKVCDELDFE